MTPEGVGVVTPMGVGGRDPVSDRDRVALRRLVVAVHPIRGSSWGVIVGGHDPRRKQESVPKLKKKEGNKKRTNSNGTLFSLRLGFDAVEGVAAVG